MSNLSYHQPRVPLAPSRLLLRTISGHKSYVTSVSFFGPQCDRLITGSYDEVAKLWDLNTGRCLHKFSGHTDGITFAMPGPEGRILTASEDRTLRVWDADNGECVRIIRSHSGAVTGLCSAGPDRIVTCSADKKLRVFDITGHICGEAELDSEIMAVACAPLPAPTPPPPLLGADTAKPSSSSSSSMQLSAKAGAPSSSSSSSSHCSFSSSFCSLSSPSASAVPAPTPAVVRVFACGGTHIPAPARPMLRRVDVETASTSGAVSANAGSLPASNLRTREAGMVTCVAISAAGSRGRGVLVTGSYDKAVRVMRNVLSPPPPSSSSEPNDDDNDDEEEEGDDDDDNDDDDDGGRLPRGAENAPPPHPSPESSSSGGGAFPPVSMRVLGRHEDGVRSVAVSADGRWAVSGGREGTIKVWEISEEEDALAAAAVAAAGAGTAVAETSRAKACFQAHRGVVFSLCMSPDSRVLVSAGSDNDVRVWDLSLVVYSRRMCLNRLRALWTAGRIRRARPKRNSGGGGASSPKRSSGGAGGGEDAVRVGEGAGAGGGVGDLSALEAFGRSREQRQQILENLFALPDIIYAKIFMYV